MNIIFYKKPLALLIIGCLCLVFLSRHFLSSLIYKRKAAYTIGIIQAASHPALDQAAKGFKDYFTVHYPGGVFVTRNVQSDVAQAYSVAKSFNNRPSVDALFTIGTLSAQAAVQTKKDKPIAIAAVSNPKENGIWSAEGLVCGSSDSIDTKEQFECIRRVYPNLKILGILYSLYEPNASVSAKNMKDIADAQGIIVKHYGISQPSDVPLVVQRITGCDVVWCPTDNTIAVMEQSIINYLSEPQALILSDILLMKKGVYASAGVDYYKTGQEAAECLAQVLFKGKKPYQVPLVYPHLSSIVVSKHLAERYNPALLAKENITWVE